jgi:hypothetical protein
MTWCARHPRSTDTCLPAARATGAIAAEQLPPQREKIFLLQPERDALIKQMKEDTDFLRSKDIMDYSLLLGSEYYPERLFAL